MSPVALFLFQAIVMIIVPFMIWSIPLVRRTVPCVVVQILFGIALGPTLLARMAPDVAALVLPAASLDRLSGVSWLAVTFFAFLTALHLDVGDIVGRGCRFLAVGASSFAVPFLCGVGLGAWAIRHVPELAGPTANDASFALAIGLSVGATALPVLGAILRETGLLRQELGRLAIGYAALNDLLLWIMITALLTMISAADNRLSTFVEVIGFTILYIAFMAFIVRPLLARLFERKEIDGDGLRDGEVVVIAFLLIASALATQILGLHYLIGAFAAGLVMPKAAKQSIVAHFESFTVFVLLPFYFILTGLKVTLDIGSGNVVAFFVLSTVVAMGSKIFGTAVPARMAGHGWRDALHFGVLMQCKGLVEVVILTVLLDAGLISNAAFSALIMMAMVTTALTMPLSRAVGGPVTQTTGLPMRASAPPAE